MLPDRYSWLAREPGPRILIEMLKVYGVHEAPGPADNLAILGWAAAIGLGSVYRHDAIPWCGLAVAYAAAEAGWDHAPRGNALWAFNWLSWGTLQTVPMLGDVLVFGRNGGGHVALYVGEDATAFHILGGNQADQVCFERHAKADLMGARRCPWRVAQPANVRRVFLSPEGVPTGLSEK